MNMLINHFIIASRAYSQQHHSPSCEEEVAMKDFDLSKKDTPEKPPTSKTQQDVYMRSVFYELEPDMEMNTSSKSSHG